MKPKNYTSAEILDATMIGLEFEFYSKIKDIEISRSLGKVLEKRVVIPLSISAIGEKPKPLYHSPVEVTNEIFKLEPDYSGGKGMYELVTGPVPLKEGKKLVNKVLDWIDQYGYTTERCSIHANISFDYDKIEPVNQIENLEVLKFILSFDERPIYKNFPTREYSVYARTINSIIPNSFFFYDSVPSDWDVVSSVTVPKEKYYGVNFTKREKGYLEFRYMGGKDYEKRPGKVLDSIDHFATSLFNVINSQGFTKVERSQLKKIFKKQGKLVNSFSEYTQFKKDFPKIEISVDLNKDIQVIKAFWEKIKYCLFDLVVNSSLKNGRFNFDSDFGNFQLAKADLTNARIETMDLIECKIEGVITNCDLYFTEIKNSRVKNCQALKENRFTNSKLTEVSLFTTNIVEHCYLENNNVPINCKIVGGVIRKGEIGHMADISKETDIVDQPSNEESMKAPKKKKETLKDWRWIKKLAKKTK